jgi:hypothetical protein
MVLTCLLPKTIQPHRLLLPQDEVLVDFGVRDEQAKIGSIILAFDVSMSTRKASK